MKKAPQEAAETERARLLKRRRSPEETTRTSSGPSGRPTKGGVGPRNRVRVSKLSPFHTYVRERQAAAHPAWIPATVLLREIVALGYTGGHSQLRAYMHALKSAAPIDPVVRFETAPGEQMQVDWVEFRKGKNPLYAFCATLGYSRYSFVEFVTNMRVETLIACHQNAFAAFGGIPRRVHLDFVQRKNLEDAASGNTSERRKGAGVYNKNVAVNTADYPPITHLKRAIRFRRARTRAGGR